ncbi:MAG: hydrogenase maturation nickel metallochaperone HypA [Desulforudis sp.]|jgi:hydrogenase nickel incorporation protein HypA/HybF|nr:hydrogenase maturation nickel metallochaperone HypA [Clostridia bacterium]MDQ7792017.1 hydrogenase maturation nickel metallochaperone HypA [Clostridia bacterium]RJX21938.1 MAG: hydrogenase maturation nickel metallochaperone HypA [Desulforudis sp.]
MHEVGLMTAVFEQITESAKANNIDRITKVKLVLGKMNGALPDALEFAFEILTPDTMFEGAVMEIEQVDITVECPKCGAESAVGKIAYFCPECGARARVKKGQEFYIDYYEGDERKEDSVEGSDGAKDSAG